MVTKMQCGKNLSIPVTVLILVPHLKVSHLLEQTSLIWLRTVINQDIKHGFITIVNGFQAYRHSTFSF